MIERLERRMRPLNLGRQSQEERGHRMPARARRIARDEVVVRPQTIRLLTLNDAEPAQDHATAELDVVGTGRLRNRGVVLLRPVAGNERDVLRVAQESKTDDVL